MTHPLTDSRIYDEIHSLELPSINDDIRAGADWQLERVIEWIKECPNREGFYHTHYEPDCESMIRDLKTAMRPQQQENK